MAVHLRNVFTEKAGRNLPVFVTFITAGYPNPQSTVPLMLAMEAGGADIIELGVPFTDPLADGPAIQESNNVALSHNVDYPRCLQFVSEARAQGLKAPVILMGESRFSILFLPFPYLGLPSLKKIKERHIRQFSGV